MSHQPRYAFTVFTATFDRAWSLPNVKASLEAQTFKDFEWLIVDDGSTDGTRELVAGWVETSPLDIRYLHQPNSGKHVAYNRGVREAMGAMFVSLDSDDECVPEALERMSAIWDTIPEAERDGFKGVTVLCMDEHGHRVGDGFPTDPYDSDSLEMYFSSVGRGEKWGSQRIDVLRRFPFPEPEDLAFVPESVLLFDMARYYKTRCVNEMLRIHRLEVSGPRLTNLTRTTARGRLYFHQQVLTKYMDYFRKSPPIMVRTAINYSRYSFDCGYSPLRQLAGVPGLAKLLVLVCLTPGAGAAVRDRLRSRRQPQSAPRERAGS